MDYSSRNGDLGTGIQKRGSRNVDCTKLIAAPADTRLFQQERVNKKSLSHS